MDDQQLGSLIRAIRLRRHLRQVDIATVAGISRGSVSLVERGHFGTLSLETVRRVAATVEVRVEVVGRWRGVDLLAWHAATVHLLVIELKTEFEPRRPRPFPRPIPRGGAPPLN